jgi:thioredoxin 1
MGAKETRSMDSGKETSILNVTDDTFESSVVKNEGPVLVDFWAPWCGPCRTVGPLVEQLAQKYDGKLTVAKMNVDENKVIPGRLGIRGIPTLMLYKGGSLVDTLVGAVPLSDLEKFVKKWIA